MINKLRDYTTYMWYENAMYTEIKKLDLYKYIQELTIS